MAKFKKKTYSSLELNPDFESTVSAFLEHCANNHTESHLQNMRRRCRLFLKCMQFWGITRLEDITYEDIRNYDCELSHLKKISKVIEEATLHQFLKYLSDKGYISSGKYLYMYLLDVGGITRIEELNDNEQKRINELKVDSMEFSADAFLDTGLTLVNRFLDKGYNDSYVKEIERAIRALFLFLDINELGYSAEIADIWLNSDAAKSIFQGSTWNAARRAINVFRDYSALGEADFHKVYRKGITVLADLPDWCRIPLMQFAEQRIKTKLEEKTVKNDIYSLLRFCKFIVSEGLNSYEDLTGEIIHQFNLKDIHSSNEGKNACNIRIRRFLKYLYREGLTAMPGLHYALGTATATVETVVRILDENEINTIQAFVETASSPLELRDSAIIQLGADMGIRGSDIVNLKFSDIDWKGKSIRFSQNKTDSEVWLAMPTSVGNAIYKYLRYGRPQMADSEYIFVGMKAPFERLTRCICYETLNRILPNRNAFGSGFHITRKTFASNRLRNGVCPAMIADAMGHAGTDSLMPYLSLDKDKMVMCPLPLRTLGISFKGGF